MLPPKKVSIQLMSPASGDKILFPSEAEILRKVSIQLMSPASGDNTVKIPDHTDFAVSIQLMSPASGDVVVLPILEAISPLPFPFN